MGEDNPQSVAREFVELFGRIEYALKRSGQLVPNADHAQADWTAYAKSLGAKFYNEVAASGIADTLINRPPRKLMREGLEWSRGTSAPLENVHQLMIEGVCRVRNSYIHGEKFVGGPDGQWNRDAKLVREALEVLKLALSQKEP